MLNGLKNSYLHNQILILIYILFLFYNYSFVKVNLVSCDTFFLFFSINLLSVNRFVLLIVNVLWIR